MKRILTLSFSLLILPALLFAGKEAVLLPAGSAVADGPANEVLKLRQSDISQSFDKVNPYNNMMGVSGTIDTLDYGDSWTVNFGFFGQDVMVQWFEAPADMDINSIEFQVSDYTGPNLEVKLVDVVWTKEQIQATQTELGASWWGWYEATGNGFNDIEPFQDNLATTGGWVEGGDAGAANNWGSPFGADIWSDFGAGLPVTTDPEDGSDFYEVEMSSLFVPQVLIGDIFGVAIKNQSTTLDADRAGLAANNALGFTGFKYYANGRLTTGGPGVGDPGWWTRLYTWDIAVRVDLTGDRAPVIESFTQLPTTLSTADRTVEAVITDDNPGGGDAGVASATLSYSTDGGTTFTDVAMTGSEPNFSGIIPGQAPGTEVSYYITAEDVGGLSTTNITTTYFIFEATEPVLLVYDDNSFGLGTIVAFWMAQLPPDTNWVDGMWGYDIWDAPNGPVSLELLTNYQQVYHLMGVGPVNQPADPGSVYKAWMDEATADDPRNLFLSGQDYGYISGFADTTFPAGSFEYDYLGVETLGPQDINFAIQDQFTPYAVDYVEGDPLTGWLANFATDTSFLAYNPTGPLGFANWIDNLTPSTGTPILTDPNTGGAAVAVRNQGDNWKATSWTLDPLGLDMIANADSARTYWVSGNNNPAVPVFEWFGEPITAIEDVVYNAPETFALGQNYPNPFNPVTKIQYTVPATEQVTLKVFDITGREVVTLVDGKKVAGTYTVQFDARDLSSGMYIYTVKAGSFEASKKMLLVK